MFVYSVRASTLKLCALIAVALLLIVGVSAFSAVDTVAASAPIEIRYSGMKSNEDRVAFIEQFGIRVVDDPVEEKQFLMPENFDRIISGYNELQKKQGLDLSKYSKKKVTRYTYKVENYDSEGEVFVNLFVHRQRIIACDISSIAPEGFVVPLTLVDKEKLKNS